MLKHIRLSINTEHNVNPAHPLIQRLANRQLQMYAVSQEWTRHNAKYIQQLPNWEFAF